MIAELQQLHAICKCCKDLDVIFREGVSVTYLVQQSAPCTHYNNLMHQGALQLSCLVYYTNITCHNPLIRTLIWKA